MICELWGRAAAPANQIDRILHLKNRFLVALCAKLLKWRLKQSLQGNKTDICVDTGYNIYKTIYCEK